MNGGLDELKSLYETYKSGDYFKAESGIRAQLETSPNDVQALQLGALTALSINQTVTAHKRVDRATALTPMTAELANIRGRVLKNSGDWAAAEDAYDLALELDPAFHRARINRLNLFLVSEQPKKVLETLKTDFDFGEVGVVAQIQALTDLGWYQQALDETQPLSHQDYADQQSFQSIKCYAGLGRLEDMENALKALPITSPLFAKAMNVVVNFYEMRGLRDKALSVLDKLPEDCPIAVKLERHRLWKALGRALDAKTNLQSIFQQNAKDVGVLCEVANEARQEGQFSKSCDLYKEALEIRPGNFSVMAGYAQSAISDNRFEDAHALLQAGLNQSPNNQLLLALVATLLRKMGRDHRHLYNYNAFVKAYDLTPPDGYSDMTAFNTALKARLDQLHVYKAAPINQTLKSGSQTELDLALIDDPILQSFFMAVDQPIREYIDGLDNNPNHPLSRRRGKRYRISGAWSIRLSENGHHINHVHPMGWLSSAYYVDLPKSVNEDNREGWIQFGQPNLNIDLDAEHFVQPKAGRLVLFPSYMWHGTLPFKGPDTRLTLPFDVVPA